MFACESELLRAVTVPPGVVEVDIRYLVKGEAGWTVLRINPPGLPVSLNWIQK